MAGDFTQNIGLEGERGGRTNTEDGPGEGGGGGRGAYCGLELGSGALYSAASSAALLPSLSLLYMESINHVKYFCHLWSLSSQFWSTERAIFGRYRE